MTVLSKCLWCGTCDCLKLLYSYSLHNSLSSRTLWIDKHTKCATSSGPVSCNQTLVESLATRPSLLEVLILPFFFDSAFAVCILQKQNQGRPENGAKYKLTQYFYHSLRKQHPRPEHHTSLTKWGVGTLSSVKHKRVPREEQFLKVSLGLLVYKQRIRNILSALWPSLYGTTTDEESQSVASCFCDHQTSCFRTFQAFPASIF